MKLLSIAIAAACLSFGLASANAASLPGPQLKESASPSLLQSVQYESSYCRQLRYGCTYKRRLGEEGEGNCRRYREACGGGGYEEPRRGGGGYCERLRNVCIYKESRGEVGEGNCRRYREECRGR